MAIQIIPDDDVLLTTEQVVAWTGLSKQTFEGWRSRKKLGASGGPPYVKLAQAVRYRRGDVKAWLTSKTISQ
jgi:predicted DNA-binding transcriptional regulator AlpA